MLGMKTSDYWEATSAKPKRFRRRLTAHLNAVVLNALRYHNQRELIMSNQSMRVLKLIVLFIWAFSITTMGAEYSGSSRDLETIRSIKKNADTYVSDRSVLWIEKGYLSDSEEITMNPIGSPIGSSILNMPQFPKDDIEGLLRTFVLYVRMPERYFPKIREAEHLNEEGDRALEELREIFFSKFFN